MHAAATATMHATTISPRIARIKHIIFCDRPCDCYTD